MSDGWAGDPSKLKIDTEVKSPLLKDGLALLLKKVKHHQKCHSESVEHDDLSKEARYYRRGHRDACADVIEEIKKAMKG